jgi:hypothetical protein
MKEKGKKYIKEIPDPPLPSFGDVQKRSKKTSSSKKITTRTKGEPTFFTSLDISGCITRESREERRAGPWERGPSRSL